MAEQFIHSFDNVQAVTVDQLKTDYTALPDALRDKIEVRVFPQQTELIDYPGLNTVTFRNLPGANFTAAEFATLATLIGPLFNVE